MNDCHKVSCIITTFNRSDLVSQAIESVLHQTYENLELIIVDDCSSEDYSAVIAKHLLNNKVTYFKNPINLGLSASRNQGIKLASGHYVAFLDDDDQWLPEKLLNQVTVLESSPKLVACSSSHIESETGRLINKGIREFKKQDIYFRNLIGPPSKLLVRMDALGQIQFDESLRHAEDWDFYIRLMNIGNIYSLETPLIIYNTGHFERMTNGFSRLTIDELRQKAAATYKNKKLIGQQNFVKRLTDYYLTGFPKRKQKLKFLREIIPDVGALTVFSSMLKRAIR